MELPDESLAPLRNAHFKAVVCFHLSCILASPKEFDGDFGGCPLDRSVNFLSGVSRPVRVDADSDATARTCHVLVRLQGARQSARGRVRSLEH